MAFCNRFVNQVEQNPGFLDHLIVSDEAVFSLNSEINTRNVRKYALHGDGHPPDHYVEFLQGGNQIMVWISLTRAGIVLGPHLVQGNLNSREYLRIIRYNVIQRDFRLHGIDKNTVWRQLGIPAMRRYDTFVGMQFPGRVISKHGDWPWPLRSPDLTVCDFFLWGYLKHKIWNVLLDQQPNNLRQLREAFVMECNTMDQAKIQAKICINADGQGLADE